MQGSSPAFELILFKKRAFRCKDKLKEEFFWNFLDSTRPRLQAVAMQTLGLSGETRRSDGRLKSIFWPTVENAWDVNYLGQQGFWICVVVGILQMGVTALSGSAVATIISVFIALVYFLGGMGVREADWPAAAGIFLIFLFSVTYTMCLGRLPGIFQIAAAGILLSNVRAAFLASQWKPAGEDEDRPTRFNETFADKLVDQFPAKTWPKLKIPFYALAVTLLLLEVAGNGFALLQRFGAMGGTLRN